ncbi:P-loop containing nucleoside triphosphate hydrolase protein [Tribonema minus]|uniref:Kinesin-like protein n=1 Tax=Tribonema minus TaxID=303371 RepID=A0A835YZS4_9STRA|nr:P-loop containing nucleoside triphosphate hydrolase protein [Tribonema minus]
MPPSEPGTAAATQHREGEDGNIRTYLRIRPSKNPSGLFAQDEEDVTRLKFDIPVDLKSGEVINNTQTRHEFKFNGVLGANATQEQVFDSIGKDAVLNVLDGYNSTIFAYGQTGSGKTFTVTGGAERYVDRGVIPRCLSLLYSEFKRRSDTQYSCYVSYLEIYNEQGYDLLDPSHETKALEDLPRVALMEDEAGNIHLKNLSMYMSATEEEALNYLFLGDTNRAISETAMNKASSRSHCIFTVAIEGRRAGGEKVTRSKLHLVDLAGSERVHKTNATGQTLQEAKYINTSLFYLEMVIVALHERTRGRRHVPYRNSMMTSVLRDSLGGNCKTVMIATINPEAPHTEESISTCRFAQRVSLIRNAAVVNEDLDPQLVIRRLKTEVRGLRDEVAYLRQEAREGDEPTEQEHGALRQACCEYVDQPDAAPLKELGLGALTLTRIRACFAILRGMVLELRAAGGGGGGDQGTVADLQKALQERDAEIAILVNMVKQGKAPPRAGTAAAASQAEAKGGAPAWEQAKAGANGGQKRQGAAAAAPPAKAAPPIVLYPSDRHVLDQPQQAFAYFRQRYPPGAAIEENKALLQKKYTTAKSVGARVNQARSTITYLKNTIEQIRRERAMEGLMDREEGKEGGAEEEDPEEAKYKEAIEQEKRVYKEGFQELRELKAEIERIQQLLEKARLKMQSDFDTWIEWHS